MSGYYDDARRALLRVSLRVLRDNDPTEPQPALGARRALLRAVRQGSAAEDGLVDLLDCWGAHAPLSVDAGWKRSTPSRGTPLARIEKLKAALVQALRLTSVPDNAPAEVYRDRLRSIETLIRGVFGVPTNYRRRV